MRLRDSFVTATLLVAVAACSSSAAKTAPLASAPPSSVPTVSAVATPLASAAAPTAAGTVWICGPAAPSPACTSNLDSTVVTPDGKTGRAAFVPAAHPAVDCFYVYPTVSKAPADNAPKTGAPEVLDVIHAQAGLFGSVCRVLVPAYRQVTVQALVSGHYFDPRVQALAYGDVRAAWRDYLAHDNGGRPFVLIGHSQGAMLLTRLIHDEIDNNGALRNRMLSALLLGGNVTVRTGSLVGGSFTHVPACTRAGQRGCVVAYSSFSATPPSFALFGRTKAAGQQVLCTDPTRLAGGSGLAHPYVPADRVTDGAQPLPGTGFVAYPEQVQVSCKSAAGASWLQVGLASRSAIPKFQETLGPAWGLHVADVTLALGDLIEAVRRQAAG